jgi:hypothetical protein
MSPSSSRLKSKQAKNHEAEFALLATGFLLHLFLDPEMSVDFQRTIRSYVPEDRSLHQFPNIYGTQSVLNVFTRTRHWYLS